ncbi:N-acetylglucosamine-6-phosphate deacetylase, partial [bacterium]|nr:N-acetylglucosamine-6-phosphate deacetylase [bacterium]
MATTLFTNGDVYTPLRVIRNGMVVAEDGRIAYAGPPLSIPPGATVIDCAGGIISPGFVDIHVHGGGGGDFMDARQDAVRKALIHHARHGTTSLLATTCTAPMDRIFNAFDCIRDMMKNESGGARILGIHMEGPYLAKPEPGCHIAGLIHDPTPDEIARVLGYGDLIRRITLAPEIPGALEFIRAAAQQGICVSGGHSMATYEEVRRAAEAGVRHITHLWSAMSTVKRVNAKRFAGMVEAALLCDDLTTEVIADGRHLPTSLLRLAYKNKGAGGLCLVSDAMRASGMPEGVYEVCGLDAVVEDGVALTMDRSCFASSIITMEAAVQHMILDAGIAPLDAL